MYLSLILQTARLGLKNIRLHKLRSFLTTLGIICGVGAVICMLSVSEGGAEAEMALIRLLGTENVIVRSVKPEGGAAASGRSRLLMYGLTRGDLAVIRGTIPHVERVIPLREVGFEARHGPLAYPATTVGTDPSFFDTVHVTLASGRFLETLDEGRAAQVCVIGDEVRRRLFEFEDPRGKRVVVVGGPGRSPLAFEVVGVLNRVQTAGSPSRGAGDRDLNSDIYVPLSASFARYGDTRVKLGSGSREFIRCTFSDFYVQVDSLENVVAVSLMVRRALAHTHGATPDYTIKVPLESLRMAEAEKRRRQVTLGCIAGISLLVGGIGIMNIMLATVTERTHEIGIRRALGAKRRHITAQFLIESLILSSVGGIIGVIAGWAGAHMITRSVGWPTVIHEWTIFVSLGLALAVGLFFGIYPAAAAARLDPIEALRHT